MKLRIVALGGRMPGWVSAGFERYARRLPRDFTLELIELKPEPRHRGRTVVQLLAAERQRIAAACAECRIVALDERGAPWTTRVLADRLAAWRDENAKIAFVIGSADGLDPLLKRNAAFVVQVSALTLPHALVRILLAEQLYRAASLLTGHPYHRD